jgi:hypothetical protein
MRPSQNRVPAVLLDQESSNSQGVSRNNIALENPYRTSRQRITEPTCDDVSKTAHHVRGTRNRNSDALTVDLKANVGVPHVILLGGDTVKLVTVKLPEGLIKGLDDLVRQGMYPSRSSAIRAAVRDMLKRELWRIETP